MSRRVDGCILDLDGTLYVQDRPVPGAAEAVRRLRAAGVALRFATNTTRRPRSELVRRLAAMGIDVHATELHTAPVAAAGWLADAGYRRVCLLLAAATFEEFGAFEVVDERPDAVVVGDLGTGWSYEVLNRAFLMLRGGARLVAIQRNRAWDPGDGLRLDAGPFVAALEYAAACDAVLVGKPSVPFFRTAAQGLGLPMARIAVVGDSVENDVVGGQAAGCQGVAVRTGTFQEADVDRLDAAPDGVLTSVAELPGWVGV